MHDNEEYVFSKHNEELYDDTDEDINTLRYTLLQCRKQLFISIKSLIDTEFAFSKVELREDFDRLKISCDNLKNETNLLKIDFQDIINNCKLLVQQTTDILSERDYYYSEWQYSRNILTPRPDWDKCSDLIINWKNLSIEKTSEQLVDVLINEIISDDNKDEYLPTETNTFFEESSSSEKKLIKNRHMRRRITGLLIKEIWSNKIFEIKLTDYVFDYLTKRFDSKELAIEISYNIKDACYRYRNNYEINLFWQILTGQIEENVYHYEIKEFARILQYFIKLSSSQSLFWTISWLEFTNVLHELHPNWTNECISKLIISAEKQLQQSSNETNELKFVLLFTEDDEGRVGEFLKSIRKQLQFDKNEYIEKIKDILIDHPIISIKQFKQAVQLVDPLISKQELHRYVNWVFEPQKIFLMDMKEGIKVKMRDYEEIIFRLERCSCFMH